jgi:VWFA-related protein
VSARAAAILVAALCTPYAARAQDPPPDEPVRFEDRAEVGRVLVEARVIGPGGRPLLGLKAEDFVLSVDGREVPLESVHWIGAGVPEVPAGASDEAPPTPAGRLVVLLFQVDLHPTRTPGLMRLVQEAQRLVRTFEPRDRVAVLSFDSRLRLWQDFTVDKDRVATVIRRSVLFREPVGRRDEGVLAPHLPETDAADAASMEQALSAVAQAIEPLPGSKSIVLVGATMGRAGFGLESAYDDARRSFARSHTTVFALDVTDADAHTLDFGLQQVAADTGGFFARTHQFAGLAVSRVKGALAGHYLLAFERPEGAPGSHEVDLRLRDGRGEVFTAPGYVD